MHPIVAFLCFIRVLFGRTLPRDALAFLPEDVKTLPPGEAAKAPEKVVERVVEKPAAPRANITQAQRDGALALLALMQREGRLVDFLRDSVDGAGDADIGAAAREVHRGCRKVLDEVLSIEPVMPGEEEQKVSVPKGFDPAEIRLIGEAKGEAPFKGTLRHHGWRVVDAKLPTLSDGVDRTILAPAEVEL